MNEPLIQPDRGQDATAIHLTNKDGFDEVNRIERLCDQYQIPYATNIATAEVMVLGLARGDLDWRDIVNPKRK